MNLRVTLLITLGVLLAGCLKRNEFAEPPPPAVTVQTVAPHTVTVYDMMPGQTAAVEEVELVARVQGFLQSKEFEAGSQVKKDQVLFIIDPAEYQANLEAAQGKLSSANASRDLADTTFKRNKELFATQAISELEMLQSEADLDLAKGNVEQAKASVQRAELDMGYTKIKSPIDGQVSREFVTTGNLVGPGVSNSLARVVSLDPIYFYFNLDERSFLKYQDIDREYKREKGGKQLEVGLELANGEIFNQRGRIDYADNQVDPQTGTIEVRAVFPNPDKRLYPGLFGNVRFANEVEDAIVVSEEVIQKDLKGDYVLVVGDQNIVAVAYVKKGPRVENGIIIESGLEAGAKLIVNGIQRARPGAPVKIEEQPVPAPE